MEEKREMLKDLCFNLSQLEKNTDDYYPSLTFVRDETNKNSESMMYFLWVLVCCEPLDTQDFDTEEYMIKTLESYDKAFFGNLREILEEIK